MLDYTFVSPEKRAALQLELTKPLPKPSINFFDVLDNSLLSACLLAGILVSAILTMSLIHHLG